MATAFFVMAGTITALRFQQKTADRVNVYLDGHYAFSLPALDAARLRVGQFLDDATIAQLQTADRRQMAYDRAVRYLSFRPRSVAEVRRYLAKTEEDPEVIAAVIGRLTENGYLDDSEFARFWVENRQRFRPKGTAALRQELRQHGLDSETIAAALDDMNPSEAAYQAGRNQATKLINLARTDPKLCRRKLGEFLLRRGFDHDTVQETVSRLMAELQDESPDNIFTTSSQTESEEPLCS
ncbi:MAG: RecX family transcriptional regulator [Anaerolineae bacterium]|nr:RecX family transcriptional regulator [Anaerolineae bacterium]